MAYLTASDITITLDPRDRHILGKIKMSEGSITFGDGALTYPTNGIPMPAIGNFGMNKEVVALAIVDDSAEGLVYRYNQANRKIKIFTSSVFTGTAPVSSLDLGTPAFSGTGLTAAGQAITTTDTQTMTLNQCAGMWLMAATVTAAPLLIVSNTAVTAAAAVLTVKGAAATDAGDYKIVKALTPAGTNAVSPELTNATAVAATTLKFMCWGR